MVAEIAGDALDGYCFWKRLHAHIYTGNRQEMSSTLFDFLGKMVGAVRFELTTF